MAEIINGIFDKDRTLKENATPDQIDAAYDKLDINKEGVERR